MRRVFLVYLLVASLCQGSWSDGRELLPRLTGSGQLSLQVAAPLGVSLATPEPIFRFAEVLAPGNEAPEPFFPQRSEFCRKAEMAWVPTVGDQTSRFDRPILPAEWRLAVPRLPRSDG